MPTTPGSISALRAANRIRVIRAVREAGGLSQAQIARRTQLSPATVSGIIRDLVEAGFLRSEAGSGRRGATITVSPDAGVVAGVDFGHSHLQVAIADLAGHLRDTTLISLAPDAPSDSSLHTARELLDRLLDRAGLDHADLRAVGMAIPAPIGRDGVIDSGSILPGWVGVRAQTAAESAFERPTVVDNDANLCALAEWTLGTGRGHDDLVYIKIASGVGGGLVLGGRVHRGGLGTAGELGHLTMDESGPLCRCGSRGCLEAYVGGAALIAQYAPTGGQLDVPGFVQRALHGDLGAQRLIQDAGRHLGEAVATVANLLGPEVVVLGGDLAEAGDLLLDEVRASMRRHALTPVAREVHVTRSELEGRASCQGAVLRALEAVEVTA